MDPDGAGEGSLLTAADVRDGEGATEGARVVSKSGKETGDQLSGLRHL